MFGTPLVAKQKLLEEGGARKERVTGGLSFRPWPKVILLSALSRHNTFRYFENLLTASLIS